MLRDQGRNVTVFEREPEILHSLAPRLRRLVSDLATKQGISIQRSISPTAKIDFAILATPAAPPVALTNLPRASDGFFRVDSYLRATPAVFAAGDCISFGVPKAGVFAVREAKVIAHNLRALLRGSSLTPYHPQKNYLVLLALGKTGVAAARGKFATFHPLFRFWKDKIDRKFMRKFGANAYPSRPT
jgi:NADH dehydrogenase FAD-containing subunit